MNNYKYLLFVVILAVSVSGCTATAGPWRGQVVEAGTKEPIKDAVVVAVWYRSHFGGPGGPVEKFEDARETLTDEEGRFVIPEYKYNKYLRDKTRPMFTIYKPGYGAFPEDIIKPQGLPWELFSGEGAVIELPKFTNNKDRRDSVTSLPGVNWVPKDKAPILYEYINEERRTLGLPSIGG